jgi:hypothetical protein
MRDWRAAAIAIRPIRDWCAGSEEGMFITYRPRGRIVPSVEGIYVVEFGDVGLPRQQFRNGGVALLQTQRVFGGDSGYYYVGTYAVKDSSFELTARIVKHDPNWINAFGDESLSFNVTMQGTVANGIIQGTMQRIDKPHINLPIRLTLKEVLLP